MFSSGAVALAIAMVLCTSAVDGSYASSEAHQASLARARRTQHKVGSSSIHAALRGTSNQGRGQPDEEVEAWKDGHLALASAMTQSQLSLMGANITKEAYDAKLHEVFNSGGTGAHKSRFVGAPGNAMAASWIQKQLQDIGCDTWTEDLVHTPDLASYVLDSAVVKNVIGKITGTDLSSEAIVMGAHFDSVNWKAMDFGATDAPGVDDNGSGMAAVLLAAKALAAGSKPRRPLIFAFVNGEELGLVGSEQFAKKAATGTYGDVKGAIILDEVAWPAKQGSSLRNKAIFETKGNVNGAMALVDTMAHVFKTNFADNLDDFVVNKHGFGSDHISFLDHGIPALLLIERDDMYHADTWGHSSKDDFAHMGQGWSEYGARMTRLAARTVATLASPTTEATTVSQVNQHLQQKASL